MIIWSCFPFLTQAQEIIALENDSIHIDFLPDSVMFVDMQLFDSLVMENQIVLTPFKPDPTKAVIYSAIFPGLGQIYNRQYWKLPLVYGGFMGFTYAIMWNNKNLRDCAEAYRDLTYDLKKYHEKPEDWPQENWHQSWQNFLPANSDAASRFNDNFRQQLKRWRDYSRRNRDLSIILTVGFYLICMADAYVDAQLFDFDISPDLSMRIEPVVSPGTSFTPRLFGLNCSIKF
jgi:hypothetical protein